MQNYKSNRKAGILFLTKLYDQEVYDILDEILQQLQKCSKIINFFFIDAKNYDRTLTKFLSINQSDFTIFKYDRKEHEFLIDYVLTIGGDGTILYGAGLFQNRVTPKFIAFEKGTLGFLCKFKLSQLQKTIYNLIKDIKKQEIPYKLQSKMRIMCKKINGNSEFFYSCLNQIAITKQCSQTQVKIQIYIADKLFTITSGDGILISTPTGSTAYSLSAGGPIIQNQIKTIMIVPISPNSLSFRPICLPSNIKLTIRIHQKSRNNGFISYDGQVSDILKKNEQIQICESKFDVKVWTDQERDQLQLWTYKLKRLLNWNNQYSCESCQKRSSSKT